MRNRVHLLRSQLQKEKESIQKHKSMTEDMVRRKVEFSKLAALVGLALIREIVTLVRSTRRSPNSGSGTTPSAKSTRRRWTTSSRLSTWSNSTRRARWRVSPSTTNRSFSNANNPCVLNTEKNAGIWWSSLKTPSSAISSTGRISSTLSTQQVNKTAWRWRPRPSRKSGSWWNTSNNKFNCLRPWTSSITNEQMPKKSTWPLWRSAARRLSKHSSTGMIQKSPRASRRDRWALEGCRNSRKEKRKNHGRKK